MERYYTKESAIKECDTCAKEYKGTWAVSKYPTYYDVWKMTAFIRISPMIEIVYKTTNV
jgi:hypothetical protein